MYIFLLFCVTIIVSSLCIINLICPAVYGTAYRKLSSIPLTADLQTYLSLWVNRAMCRLGTILHVNDYDNLLVVVV